MKIYKIADAWYKFTPTVTLYHGTTEDNLNAILSEGFQPFDPSKKVDEVLNRYGYSRDTVPPWVWQQEMNLRQRTPFIFFTTLKPQAASYSKKPFGEFETSIVDRINIWLKEQEQEKLATPEYKSVVITVEAPWDKIKSYKTLEEYKETVKRVEQLDKDETNEEYLTDLAFEFWLDQPLSPDHIVKWEYSDTMKDLWQNP